MGRVSTVFIGNVSYDTTEEHLTELFKQIGNVKTLRIVYDSKTKKPRGYGFCEYNDNETAMLAVRNLDGHPMNGRNLRVALAEHDGPRTGQDQSSRSQDQSSRSQDQSSRSQDQSNANQSQGWPPQRETRSQQQPQLWPPLRESPNQTQGWPPARDTPLPASQGQGWPPPREAQAPPAQAWPPQRESEPVPERPASNFNQSVAGGYPPNLPGPAQNAVSQPPAAHSGAIAGAAGVPPAAVYVQPPSYQQPTTPTFPIQGMNATQVYNLMVEMKQQIEKDATQVQQLLLSNQGLTETLLQGQIMLGMLPAEVIDGLVSAAANSNLPQSQLQAPAAPHAAQQAGQPAASGESVAAGFAAPATGILQQLLAQGGQGQEDQLQQLQMLMNLTQTQIETLPAEAQQEVLLLQRTLQMAQMGGSNVS